MAISARRPWLQATKPTLADVNIRGFIGSITGA